MFIKSQSFSDGNCDAALFLLNHGADVNARTKQDETCLELAIKKNLIGAVEALCRLGADMSKSVRQYSNSYFAKGQLNSE